MVIVAVAAMRTMTVLLLALLVVLAAARCGGEGSGTEAETGGHGSSSSPSSTTEETQTEATTTTSAEAPCGAESFLPVLKQTFDRTAPKLRIDRAEVKRCRNDYAQVFAVPDMSVCEPGVGYCYETEQVFLRWRGGRWRILTSGTGIACSSGTETRLIVRICRALGYPDLASPTFRMPSGNIGCALIAGILRCDILSGLRPEPGEVCDFDWVGLVLPKDGAAKPNCGSDTVYDAAAPTLAYGSSWRRDGLTCDSSETGLTCTNRAGRGFRLARAGWTVS
jgi:hypothetical protein